MKNYKPAIKALTSVFLLAGAGLSAQWELVDNFESNDLSDWKFYYTEAFADPEAPPTLTIVDDPITQTASKVLSMYPGRLLTSTTNAYAWKALPTPIVDNFPNETMSTFYFRVARPLVEIEGLSVPGQVNITFGLTKQEPDPWATPPFNPAYSHYQVLARYFNPGTFDVYDNAATPTYQPINGDVPLTVNVWHEVWYLIDHSNNKFSVYIKGGSEYPEQTLVYENATYRGGVNQFEDLINFMLGTSTGSAAGGLAGRDPTYFNDLYIDPNAANLTSPVEVVEPDTWGAYTVNANGDADTGSLLGWLHVDTAPWVYAYDLGQWFYAPEAPASASEEVWTYVVKASAGWEGVVNDDHSPWFYHHGWSRWFFGVTDPAPTEVGVWAILPRLN